MGTAEAAEAGDAAEEGEGVSNIAQICRQESSVKWHFQRSDARGRLAHHAAPRIFTLIPSFLLLIRQRKSHVVMM